MNRWTPVALCLISVAVVAIDPVDLFAAEGGERLYRAYPGPPRPAEEVAILDIQWVAWVDPGTVRLDSKDYDTVELLPGTHTISWGQVFSVSFLIDPSMKVKQHSIETVNLEAGHTYRLLADRIAGAGRIYLWIEEVDTGDVVAGDKNPKRMTPDETWRQNFHSDEQAELSAAIRNGDIDTVERMLELGYDIESRDRDGRTPLWLAAWYGSAALTDLLLERDADVNATMDPPYGSTPLMIAASLGHVAVVRRLLQDPEVDVNARSTRKWSALMWAAKKKSVEMVELLLAAGAEVNVKDVDERAPLDWAKGRPVKKALRDAGAKRGREF